MDYALILSVLLLLAAPLLARVVGHTPALKGGLDGFVLVTVIALITTTLLPEALNHAGFAGLFIAATGFMLPWVAEALFHRAEEITHRVIMLIAALALVVHAASDGAILAFAKDIEGGGFLATGVVLHRIGVAIAVWWLLRPVLTTVGGLAVLAALGAMTVVGYLMVLFAGEWYNIPLIGYWQAFAAGSLFHVVMHPLEDHNTAPTQKTVMAHRVGTAFGVLFVISLISAHYGQHTPTVAPIDTHGGHHDVDLIAAIGRLLAPLLLLIFAAAAAYGRLSDGKMASAYRNLQTVTPWTLVIWLAAAVIAVLEPDLLPAPEGGDILLTIWLVVTAAVLIHTGARSFFSVLMPKFLVHKHEHS
ncbi:MAG: hypothetical protein AB3N28_04100 [Kordiimonas sp.]